MCDHNLAELVPQPVAGEFPTKSLIERLNSSASVSDLSEAASDMSLSTSPGSDLSRFPDQASSVLSAVDHVPDDSDAPSPEVYQNKRTLVRKLSSNPYQSDTIRSPGEELLEFRDTHSCVTDLQIFNFETFGDITNQSHGRLQPSEYEYCNSLVVSHGLSLNPVNYGCPDDSEDDRGGDCRSSHEMHRHIVGRTQDDHESNSHFISHELFLKARMENTPLLHHNEFNDIFASTLEAETVSSSADISNCNSHHPHTEEQYKYNTQLDNQPHRFYINSSLCPLKHPTPADGLTNDQVSGGFHCYNNENEILNLKNETRVCAYSQSAPPTETDEVPNPPKSKEINSWGHYQKSADNNYRYRRSHHSSDSDEEEAQVDSTAPLHQGITSRGSSCKPHLCHLHSPSHSQISSVLKSSVNNNLSFADTAHGRVKPHEFKERFSLMKSWFSECSDEQKNLVLKGLLGLCELPQVHLLSVLMSKELHQGCPTNCEDLITWLPRDLASKVLCYLDPVSLCNAAQVCRVWRQLAEDQSLWRRFCCQTKWRLSKAAEHKQVISHMSPEGSIQWKHVFAERFRLRNNWLKGRCTVRTFEGHLQGISCVQFDDSRIVSGSSDKTIKVWNMRTNAPWSVQTLMGHHGTVRCLYLEGNRLVSGSCDKTIKVWDLSTQESWSSIACKVTMTGHLDTVRCLQADDDKVISGSYDKTLKIWDLRTGTLRRTLKGHQASVLCVHFSETKIVSGSADKTIKVWNYEGNCMMTLCGHQDAVTCLMFDATRIVSGSLDHNLKFWDIQTGECLNTIDWKKAEGHTDVVRCLQADSWRVVSAGDDKTIKVWNLATGERLVTLRNHTDGVTCLQFNDFIIVSGSYDKTVKLWDFSCC